jgi:hypothetical protein
VDVEAGTVLLGTAFPMPPSSDQPRQWRAVLLVDAGHDPNALFDAYVSQAAALGLAVATTECGGDSTLGRSDVPARCEAGGFTTRTGPTVITFWDSSPRPTAPWAHHLVLTVPEARGEPFDASSLLSSVGPTWEPEDVGPPPAVPTEGEPIAPSQYDPMAETITVLDGSALLGPVVPSGFATGGYVGVLRITGDAADVVDAYADEGRPEGMRVNRDEYRVEDRRVISASWDEAGGIKFSITAATSDTGDWYALIEVGND